ncbi:MAG: methionine gamma-lyase family protein [Oscillospiraceae bacterium]|nr:methionine gamma-lyase family protein [Oscillospiraceae bacterium]
MQNHVKKYLKNKYSVEDRIIQIYDKAMEEISDKFCEIEDIKELNTIKILDAFQKEKVSESHFQATTGYGYGDIGRDGIDRIYSNIFHTESALVRPHFVNGTHAIYCAISGNLRPGDTLLAASGKPYDTLHNAIGIGKKSGIGSLKDYGIFYKEIPLRGDFSVDLERVLDILKEDKTIKMVHLQRSRGYSYRESLSIKMMEEVISFIKNIRRDVIVFVDNCYGEFVDTLEPTDLGADLIAGSLIKNPGGGISNSGGYIAGKDEFVEQASFRLTVPGIGGECGSNFGVMRNMYQGLFLSPLITMEALKSAILCSKMGELLGYETIPKSSTLRTDIVQAIKLGSPEKVIEFCRWIQYSSPVDSFLTCEPWDMPGYDDKVIMASGSFIQGSSIEASCDAPIREPYVAYYQGGLNFCQAKIGIILAYSKIGGLK